jgi:hypothetical protein
MEKQTRVRPIMDPLDEPKAALRVLIQLSIHPEGLNVTALYDEMGERFESGEQPQILPIRRCWMPV